MNEKQKLFHVTYFYLATGMEGNADTQDYGNIFASSAEEAKKAIALQEYPKPIIEQESFIDHLINNDPQSASRDFFYGCLTAKEIK